MSFIDFDTPTESADGFVDFTKPQEQIGDTAKGFKRAFAQIPELAYGAGALASMSAEHLFGEGGLSTAAKNYFGEKFAAKQAENQKYAPAVEFTDAWENLKSGDIGSMVDWLQDSAGYVAGQAIQTAVTGGIGAAVGKAGLSAATQKMLGGVVAKQAAKIAEESVAKQGLNAAAAEAAIKAALPGATKIAAQRTAQVIGAGIALNAQNLGMEAGDIYGGLTEEAAKTGREITGDDLLRAWGAAAAAAGTETATDLLGLGAVTGRIKIGGKSMQAMTGAGGKVARAGAAASVGVPIEAGQEYVQTGLEQYGAGRPTDTPEAERERINAAAVGGLGGGVVGAGAGIISSAQQPTQQSPGITPTSTPSIAQAAAEEEQKTAAGIQAIESAQDIEGITAAAIEATSQPVGPNPFVPDAEPAEFIQSEARDKNAIPAEQQVAQARSAELDAIQSGDAPNNPPVGDVGIAMQKAQQARAEQDRLALESQQSEAEKARRAKLAPQPADLPILQRIIKREPVTDAEARPLLAKGFIGTRPDGTYKVIEKGLKARNLLLRQAAVHKMGTIAPNLGMIAPEAGSDIPNVGSQLPNLGTEAGNDNIAPVIEQKPVIQPTTVAEQPIPPPSETITPKVVGGIPVSAQSDEQSQAIPATNPTIVAQSPEIAPTPSTIAPNNVSQTVQNEPIRAANEAKPRPVFGPDYEFEARNRAALKAEKDAQAVTAAAQSVSAVETLVQKSPAFTPAEQTVKPNANLSNSRGLEVAPESKGATVKKSLTPEAERFQGQLKKGMSERVARQQQTRLTKEQHNLVWTVEKSTVPEFPDRFDVVGRKPVVDQNAPEQSTKGTQEPTKAFTTAQASTQPPKVASPELEPRPAAQEPPTAAQPAAPAQPTANGEKEAQASVSQAHIPQYGKDAEMRRRIVQQSEERGFTLDERVESAISKINGGYTLAATAEALQYARGEPLQGVAKDDPVATLRYLAGKTDKQDLPFTNRAKEVLSALGEPVNTPPAPAKEAAKETDRIAEIDAELAKLQAQYEKKSAGGKLGGMVPPAVKASALKSIIDKMDKLDAEKAKLLKAAAPTKPAAEPSPAPETGIPVSAVKAESEKDSPAPAAAEASIAAEPAASPIAAAVTALQGVVADLARAVNPEAAAKPVASEYSESATPAPESAAKRSEATTIETKTPADSIQKAPIPSEKEGGIADKNIEPETPIARPEELDFQRAMDAHRGTSMVPKERAKTVQHEFADDVNSLYNGLLESAKTDAQKSVLRAEVERYKAAYLAHMYSLLGAQSRTMSSMIAGPSNFPVARNQKRLDSAQRRLEEFLDWRKKARGAVVRAVSESRSSEQVADDAWAGLKKDIDRNIGVVKGIDVGTEIYDRHAFTNSVSGKLKRMADNGETDLVRRALDYIKERQSGMEKPLFAERNSVWALAEKAQASAEQETPTGTETVAEYQGASIVDNKDEQRVQITFDTIPGPDLRNALKAQGWRWSPSNKAWQRQNTNAAIASAKQIVGAAFETRDTDKGTALYSRNKPSKGALNIETAPATPAIEELNAAVEKKEGITNAFLSAKFNDEGLANAYKSAFGVEVVYVSPTSEAASQFLGIHYGGKIYVNPDNPHHGFIQLAGHELLHQLRRDRQDLYNFLAAKAESYRVPGAAERYSKRLESVGGTGFDVQEETLADFTGDALADPNFLKALAENNPSKFRQLLTAVVSWLKRVATKLYGKGFRSSEYFTDVNALKDYLAAVLSAYSEQKTQSVIDGVEPPSFSRAQDQTQTPEFRAWFGVSKVVDADGKPLVVYWGGEEGITEFEGSREFSSEKDNVQPVFFTKHKALAKQYAKAIDGGGEVYGVYLSIQNPLVVYGSETVSGRMSIDVIARKLELAQKNGNDGIIFKGVQDSPYVTKSHGPVTDIYVAFSPTQIKSAIGNTGTFDPTNPDIRYSRAAVQGGVGQGAREVFSDIVRSDRTLNRVISKFNTPFHIAETRPEFKPVYDEAQDYNQDVSRFANEGADLAPDLLPRIESFADFKKQTPNSEDVANTADALYAGTLWGGGSPLEGRVWSDSELKSGRAEDGDVALPANFKPMNDKQISLYRQALAAVAHSLTEHSKSLIWRLAKQKDIQLNSSVSLGRMASLADTMAEQQIEGKRASLEEAVADDKPKIQKEIDELEAFRKAVADIEEKTNGLIEHGYFPAMRFGQYAVNVQTLKDGKWTEEYFGRFETQTAANLAKRELIKEFPNSQVTSGVMNTDAYKLFQGLNLDSLELFAKHMTDESGKPVDIDPIMQEYFRIATTERSTLKRQIHRKGTPGFSKDVARALAQFTVSNATATSRAYHAAGMMEKVQRIKAGDLQAYATRYVRYLQDPQEEAAMLRGFLANYYILGSIAFGAVNMTQPILMTAPYLSEHTSWTNAMKQLGIAAKDLVTGRKSLTPDEKAAYEKAVKAGTVAPQEIHQIRAEGRASMMGDSPLWQKMEAIAESRGIKMPGKLLMRKAAFLWGSIYSLTESWNRGITFLAAYRIAKAKGGVNPYDFAKNAVDATQGVYAKSNRPEISRGAVGSAVMTFKQFSIAYVELAKRLYDHDKKAFAVLMLTLMALAGAEGLPFAEDIEDLIDTIGQWMGYATNTKKALRKRATEILGKDIADMMLHGASAIPGMPIDVAQRMGMHNLIPGSATLKTSEPDKTRDIVELLGPAAGLFKNTGTAIEGVATGKPGNLKMLLPLALQNVAKGAEIAETGQFRDMKGRKVMDADLMDAMVKLVGFQPAKVAQESRIVGQNMQDIGLQKVIESSIADKWARGIADNDPAKVAEARQQMREWNADNPELRVIINPGQIARRVKELRLSREQRFLKSAPREIRGGMRQDLGR